MAVNKARIEQLWRWKMRELSKPYDNLIFRWVLAFMSEAYDAGIAAGKAERDTYTVKPKRWSFTPTTTDDL